MTKITIVKCPQCGTDVEWGEQSPHRPFCSKKCQMIDFGEWADEE
ncbi:DNA gyrase inhibitor YacG, partial [Vibrio vulnificus]|nr:DNA gyrase inhibitor YacG [Vibrio vulnificus]